MEFAFPATVRQKTPACVVHVMRAFKQLFRPNLRLLLFFIFAFAVYFAVTSSIPRDLEVKQAVENRDIRTLKRMSWWFPSTVRQNSETDSILLDAIDLREDNVDLVEAVLIAKPNLGRQRENDRATPLTTALETGQDKIARLLIDEGANPNEAGASGLVPLHCVAKRGGDNLEMVRLLLDRGADPRKKSPRGLTFVQSLISYNSASDTLAILKFLQKRDLLELRETDEKGNTLLHIMCDSRKRRVSFAKDLDVLQYLIDHGPAIDTPNDADQTPAFVAVASAVAGVSRKRSDIWRFIPIAEWEIESVQFLVANRARVDFDDETIERIFANQTKPSTEPVYAAGIARRGGDSRCYWLSGYPGHSVWIHQGEVFKRFQASGQPFAFTEPNNKGKPVIPEQDWEKATIRFDRTSATVRCAIEQVWVEFDFAETRPPVWSYQIQPQGEANVE